MAKMTSSQLAAFVASYVAANKQAGTWNPTRDNFTGMLDKIGKQITLDGDFQDKLPELSGDELPLGKTIEEYFIDLTLPEAFEFEDGTGNSKENIPALPAVEDVVYSYTLGRKKIRTTIPYDNFERACIDASTAGNVSAKVMERLTNSQSMYVYGIKKQLLGNAATKAVAAGCVATVSIPVDTETGEAFIEQVKKDVEDASFAHEGGLGGALIGAAPSLVLYVKKGVIPNLEVQTMAGAFNKEDLALGITVKVVDDFGTNDECWAILVDPRAVKLHQGYNAIRTKELADSDCVNVIEHSEYTGFISKYVYIKAYKA